MSRWEFMRKLEELLSDISPSEREEALQYYNDYFNDAGRENEQSVIESLGSPEQVAKIVRDGLNDGVGQGEFTENGFTSNIGQKNEVVKRNTESQNNQDSFTESQGYGTESDTQSAAPQKEKKNGLPTWAIILIVIACIICSPVILGALGSVLGILLGIAGALLGIIVGFGVTAVILYIAAIALVIAGFGCIITSPLSGIGMIGGGCICAAVGILFMLLTVFIAGKCVPGICQGIAYIVRSLFGKKKGV
ncbi:MAG: DUF1700 domain-containing protein [Suilimivivens sp.]